VPNVKGLKLIHVIIERMGHNSFARKGWAVNAHRLFQPDGDPQRHHHRPASLPSASSTASPGVRARRWTSTLIQRLALTAEARTYKGWRYSRRPRRVEEGGWLPPFFSRLKTV
jgi:hypothetical protein